jgi:hypothetical protein
MAPLPQGEPHFGRAAPRGMAGLLLLAGSLSIIALLASPSAGQAPTQERVFYFKERAFRIPFKPDGEGRRIQRVELYVSREGGEWKQAATRNPRDGYFEYQTQEDGWYLFAVRTIDLDNRAYPATIDRLQPDIKVCVDTSPPEVALRSSTARDGKIGVEWSVRDANLDMNSLRLEARGPGGSWQDLQAQRAETGERLWSPTTTGNVEVRLRVLDKAGNLGEKTITLAANGERVGSDPVRPGDTATGGGLPQVRYVNSNRINFNFKIEDVGASGVAAVELWYTEDQGRSWRKHPEALGKDPPYSVTVDSEKLYGFTLIARSGVGKGEQPPQKGDQPQIYVQVDKTKPEVRLTETRVAGGMDGNNLTIGWRATDQFMRAQPITISYCERLGDEWKAIAKDLDNTGRYVWKLPADAPPRMFIRVEAVDKAGNIGTAESAEEIIVDLKVPRVTNVNVGADGLR